jgi:hypothetical protein
MTYRLSQKILSDVADDVLHHDPAFEECNLDDSQHDEAIDDATAAALVKNGALHLCGHCFPTGEFDAPTLNTRGDAP